MCGDKGEHREWIEHAIRITRDLAIVRVRVRRRIVRKEQHMFRHPDGSETASFDALGCSCDVVDRGVMRERGSDGDFH